jgi:hypothetical protein
MRFTALIAMTFVAGAALAQSSAALLESPTPASAKPAVDQLIPWLLDENQQLRGIAFGEVIFDTTGKKVLPFDVNNAIDQRVAKAISAACDETMRELNAPDSAIQNVDRINEVSGHFEESLRELLNTTPGLRCDFPLTAEGKVQRSGYPDLRVTDVESKPRLLFGPEALPRRKPRQHFPRVLFRAQEGDEQSVRGRGALRRWI